MYKEFNVKKYKQLKDELKRSFLSEKLGEQQSYADQTKLFQPLIDQTKTQNIKLNENINQAIVPLTSEVRRATDERLKYSEASLNPTDSFFDTYDYLTPLKGDRLIAAAAAATSSDASKSDVLQVNVDRDLNQYEIENLHSMNLPIPSKIKDNQFEEIFDLIIARRRSWTQKYRSDRIKDKTSTELNAYAMATDTLNKYENIVRRLQGAKTFVGKALVVRRKMRKGRPKCSQTLIYKNSDDLIQKLAEYLASYSAGNNGVYNTIIGMLDELLNTKVIDKQTFDDIIENNNLHVK